MLKAKELRLSGFGRFVEKQVIKFDSLGNLVQVDGVNNNTGGSSGAGKSTIFNALDYLLGLNDIPNSVLKSRLTDEGMNVEGDFDFDGKPLTIGRGKKLFVDLDGEVTKGSAKLTEEKLDSILGMPRNLFRNILHKRQKEGGFFLKMTPKEINEFLMNCLGLSPFKAKIEIIEKKAKELSEKRVSVASSLQSSRSALEATQDAILALGLAPVRDIHQSVILQLKQKYDQSASDLSTILGKHKLEAETLELSRPQLEQKIYDKAARKAYEVDVSAIRQQVDSLMSQERYRVSAVASELGDFRIQKVRLANQIQNAVSAKAEAVKVALEIKKIRESICPTCEQSWVTENIKVKQSMLMEKVGQYKEIIAAAAKAEEDLKQVEEALLILNAESAPRVPEGLEALKAKIVELDAFIAEDKRKETDYGNAQHHINKAKLDSFADQQKRQRESHSLEQGQFRGQADVDRRAFEAAVGKLKAYEDARVRYEYSVNSLKAQEESHLAKVEEFTKSLDSVQFELAMAEELKRGLKSYLSCSFDDALETISEDATKLIRSIPNMANATIQLEGVRETKDGKVKEEVNAVIHMDGEENVNILSLCGGERTSTDLAIDLSVINLIEDRANKGIDLFILDEPFDGLDTVCIEMALEVLKTSSINKKLFIVDHNPEVKQMVESRLVVTRDGATSKITQS